MTEEIPQYIAISIAESRLKKAKDALRPRLLQQAQLEGGRIIDDGDGVVADIVPCPACDRLESSRIGTGNISVPYPAGLEAGEMAQPSIVKVAEIPDDVLVWAVRHGVLKVSVENKAFEVYSNDATPESAHNMGVVGRNLVASTTNVLRVLSVDKIKKEG